MAFHSLFYSSEKLHSGGSVILHLRQPEEAVENAVGYITRLPHIGNDLEEKRRYSWFCVV